MRREGKKRRDLLNHRTRDQGTKKTTLLRPQGYFCLEGGQVRGWGGGLSVVGV